MLAVLPSFPKLEKQQSFRFPYQKAESASTHNGMDLGIPMPSTSDGNTVARSLVPSFPRLDCMLSSWTVTHLSAAPAPPAPCAQMANSACSAPQEKPFSGAQPQQQVVLLPNGAAPDGGPRGLHIPLGGGSGFLRGPQLRVSCLDGRVRHAHPLQPWARLLTGLRGAPLQVPAPKAAYQQLLTSCRDASDYGAPGKFPSLGLRQTIAPHSPMRPPPRILHTSRNVGRLPLLATGTHRANSTIRLPAPDN